MNGEAFELEFNHTISTTVVKVKGWLVNYLGNVQDAEDVLSESIKDLWKFGEKFDGDSSLATPFFTIARRRVADFLRNKYGRQQADGLVRRKWWGRLDDEWIVPYLSTQFRFRLNMLLHPLWKHKLDGDQVGLLGAIKKTMED